MQTPTVAPEASPATKHGIPYAAAARLEALGFMDPDSGATRSAKARRCESCSRPIVRGLDHEWAALTVACDIEPLSPLGEARARFDGRRTYSLAMRGGRYELDRRDSWLMRGQPAGTGRIDILVEHRCRESGKYERAPSNLPIPQDNSSLPDQPPF